MALIDDVKDNAVSGLLIGIGAAILAPVVLPILASIARPLAKGAIKGGIMLYEKGKEAVAEAGEMVEDLVAEAKAEISEEQQAAMAAGGATAAWPGPPPEAAETAEGPMEPLSGKEAPA